MLETVELVKTFGLRPVLRGVDVRVGPGAFLALFGPNGAGKTTLLRILATLSRPTTGQVIVAGWQLPKQARAARGLLFQSPTGIMWPCNRIRKQNGAPFSMFQSPTGIMWPCNKRPSLGWLAFHPFQSPTGIMWPCNPRPND